MSEFFRFRSIDALLGKRQELEEQTIYFASPEELNDPMEGLRDIVWNGDKIVWTNFFKHYIFCLNRSYLLLNITKNPRKLDVTDLPILEGWNQITIPIEKDLFDNIWYRFYNLPYIQEIIEALANTSRKIRYREIVCHLQGLQITALLDEIRQSYINHGLISESPFFQAPEEQRKTVAMELLLNAIKHAKNEQALDDSYQALEEMLDNLRIYVQYQNHTIPSEMSGNINRDIIFLFDFAKVYVEQLDRLLWSKWYTACFTGNYHNSSAWAKYADSHKGVCLIFEGVEKDNSNSIELNHKTSNSSITLPFRQVNYADRPDEIDFFRTICRMTVSTLKKLWYTDQDGNLSECAAHIEPDGDESIWREIYRNNFLRDVTFKTKDWEYEQEYRLILEDTLSQFNEKNDRKLTYDFGFLKGIIFGIRTSIEDKMKVIEIIDKKNQTDFKQIIDKKNQTDFEYFQAYYSSKGGDIQARRIWLP